MHTIIASLLLVTACKTIPPTDPQRAAAELLAANMAFAALSKQANPKTAFAAFLAPNGMMFPRGADGPVEGIENTIPLFGEADDPGYQLLWQPQFAEISEAGDFGWTWGKYQVVIGDETQSTGKYINIWNRQDDGSWKVRVDFGNVDPE